MKKYIGAVLVGFLARLFPASCSVVLVSRGEIEVFGIYTSLYVIATLSSFLGTMGLSANWIMLRPEDKQLSRVPKKTLVKLVSGPIATALFAVLILQESDLLIRHWSFTSKASVVVSISVTLAMTSVLSQECLYRGENRNYLLWGALPSALWPLLLLLFTSEVLFTISTLTFAICMVSLCSLMLFAKFRLVLHNAPNGRTAVDRASVLSTFVGSLVVQLATYFVVSLISTVPSGARGVGVYGLAVQVRQAILLLPNSISGFLLKDMRDDIDGLLFKRRLLFHIVLSLALAAVIGVVLLCLFGGYIYNINDAMRVGDDDLLGASLLVYAAVVVIITNFFSRYMQAKALYRTSMIMDFAYSAGLLGAVAFLANYSLYGFGICFMIASLVQLATQSLYIWFINR